MTKHDVIDEYFNWIYNLVSSTNHVNRVSYKKLLMCLHNIEFRCAIEQDANRAEDGINVRRRYSYDYRDDSLEDYLDGPCSVLEMMVALAIRCEEHIMDNPEIGNRTGKWFWDMIQNLGLGSMNDARFNKRFVEEKIRIFLDREYEPNGKGGLFTVKNTRYDMRNVEIWYQMCWYLNEVLED